MMVHTAFITLPGQLPFQMSELLFLPWPLEPDPVTDLVKPPKRQTWREDIQAASARENRDPSHITEQF